MAEKPSEKPPAEPAGAAPTIDTSASATTATTKPSSGAESPRTARDPDFDDDEHEQSLPVPEGQPTSKGGPKRVSFQEDDGPAPQKPPRPMSPRAKAEATLIEAFPSIDIKVVKAVLVASNGKVEPAFNALLGMSDPDFVNEPAAPAPPPRRPRGGAGFPLTQEESDAMYARQLAEHYDSAYDGFGAPVRGDPPLPRSRRQDNLKPNELYDDRERSFIDDDLPIIKQNLQKGFEDTKKTINKWFKDLQKKMDGDDEDDISARPQVPPRRQDFGPSKSDQMLGIRKSAEGRRSGERDRYDADPQVLGDDFGHRLELRDDEAPPPRPPRPLANPDLFKGSEQPAALGIKSAAAAADRKGPPSAAAAARPASGKWQPLASVEPKPADELEDHDPFSLGDSDDEAADASKSAKAAADVAQAAKKDAKPEAKKGEGAVAAATADKKGA